MGRWVTSKGRRIYIPDEGEENPFSKENREKRTKEVKAYMEETGKGLPEAVEHYRYEHPDEEAARDKAKKQLKDQINKDFDLSSEGTYKLNGQKAPENLPRVSDEDAKHNKMVDYKGTKYSTQQVVDYNKEKGGEYVAGHMYVPHDDLSKGSFFVSKDGEMYHSGSDYLKAESKKKMDAQINKDFDLKEKQIANNKRQTEKANQLKKNSSNKYTESKMERLELQKDNLLAKGQKKFNSDPNQWLLYGEEGKQLYYEYKDAKEEFESAYRKYRKQKRK